MATLSGKQIQAEARKILDGSPNGIQWSKLLQAISATSPATPKNTIQGNLHKLLTGASDIQKISKGVYALSKSQVANQGLPLVVPVTSNGGKKDGSSAASNQTEQAYYQPFADWLRDQLEDATEVMAVGGNVLKGKWGTPDVIGVLKPQTGDLVKFQPQIVSAEIKIDPTQTIVAFGQAVSYRLFSHKSYIVVPETTPKDDVDRLEALAIITGIGLVTFTLDPVAPNFSLVVRAALAEPDMYYVNEMARRLHAAYPKEFNRLF
ncbi:MAG: hypothetical protein DI601_06410 [Azospirillum brasilense]|nr:MAG: hypothetical protein DI601_06410 [Azospirillum brasilense]PZR08553.1 MAG: hypothetical protein DI532_21605 [Azospirillum brasilense]